METQNFVANGNPRPLLRIDPAQTFGKIEVARKLGSECIVGKPDINRGAPGFRGGLRLLEIVPGLVESGGSGLGARYATCAC